MLTLRDIASLSQDLQRLHRKCCEEHANLVKQRNAFFHQVLVQRRKFQEEASMKVRQYEAQVNHVRSLNGSGNSIDRMLA